MTNLNSNPSFEEQAKETYDMSSPLWDSYFRRVRKNVRFPRNYKVVSVLDSDLPAQPL